MYKILRKRGTGKTTSLITLAKDNGATLVVANADYTVQKMYQLGITGVNIISYAEFYANRQEYFTKPYMIDDIDGFVESIFGRKLIGYSASIDD